MIFTARDSVNIRNLRVPFPSPNDLLVPLKLFSSCKKNASDSEPYLRIRSDLLCHDRSPNDLLVPMKPSSSCKKTVSNSKVYIHRPLTGTSSGFVRQRANGYCTLTFGGYAFFHSRVCAPHTIWQCARRSRSKCTAQIMENCDDFRVVHSEHNETCRNINKRK